MDSRAGLESLQERHLATRAVNYVKFYNKESDVIVN